jgi:hypothetical protein
MQLDAPNTNRGRVLARWAANAPASFAFGRLGQVSVFATGFAEIAFGFLVVCQLCWLPKNITS